MSDETTDPTELPLDVLDRIDRACDRFEANWEAGVRPRLEDYLGAVPDLYRTALLRDLLAAEIDARRRRGERPEPGEYRDRLPGDAAAIDSAFGACHDHTRVGRAETAARVPVAWMAVGSDEAPDPPEDPGTPHTSGDPFDEPARRSCVRYFGDFELLRVLGRGGMGVVYKARQRSLNRTVAVKMIQAGLWPGDDEVRRFRNEAEAAATLDHPQIVTIHEVGEYDGRQYFSMQFVDGPSLADALPHYVADPKAAARLVADVARAVHHAHERGILHRDLKPSNVVLDTESQPHVTDFGLAKRIAGDGDASVSGSILGTPSYMSPEQASGRRGSVTTATDVYGLGAVLYACLTGRPPFRGESVIETLEQVRGQPPERPGLVNRRVCRDLETVCLKCLEKDPRRRYDSAAALASDLERWLLGESVLARPVSRIGALARWCRRNPVVAGLGGTAAAALVAAAVVSVVYATEQARAKDEITGLATDLGRERERLRKSLSESNRLLAIRNFDRGQAALENGEIGPGLLWMIESWRSAVDAGDLAWQHAARTNLAAWRSHYPRIKAILSHTSPVVTAAFSPDGRTVISGGMDGMAQLWDAASGRRIGSPLRVEGQWPVVAFSPDSKTVLTGAMEDGPRVQLWDTTTGLPLVLNLRLRPEFEILAVAIQRDGRIVLVGRHSPDNVAWTWDAATGQPIGGPMTHHGHIYTPSLSPDGLIILTPSDDGTARLWELATGRPIRPPLKRQGGFRCAAFSPDGETILTGGCDGAACLWDAATGKPLGPPMRHESEVRAVAFSRDGKTILTGCQDKAGRLWDAATGRLIGLFEHQSGISAVAFSPDGSSILTGSGDGTLRLWDANPGKPAGAVLEIPSTEALIGAGGLSPDGTVLASRSAEPKGQRHVQLWNAITRQPIARLPQPGGNLHVEYTPDSKVCLTIEADSTAQLWNATTGAAIGAKLALPSPILGYGHSLCFSPDGEAWLFVGTDQAVWMCDPATGSVRGHTAALGATTYGLAFSPDGKTFLTGLDNGEVRLWDTATLTPFGDPLEHPGTISQGRFSPDGRSIWVTCEDGSIWHRDLATGKPLIPPIKGHQGPIYALAISPDGRTIATGSQDKTVRFWDSATGQPVGPALRHSDGVSAIAFLDAGRSLFTGSGISRIFPVPDELPDELARVAAWVEVMTGLRLDTQHGLVQVLDNAAWFERREWLTRFGGPPDSWSGQRLDPIHFGPEPTARARRFLERQQWEAAEAAFDEAARARPFNLSIVMEWGDLYTSRALSSEAARYYRRAVQRYPDVAPFHERLAVTLLLAGDLPGYRAACSGMLERFKPIDDSIAASHVAYACSLATGAIDDRPGLIRISERSTRWVAGNERDVGAVLFRVGRPEAALKHFDRALKVVEPCARDWLFLAMIHSGLGHTDDAHRFLQQAEQWIGEADNAVMGTGQEGAHWANPTEKATILLLRREALAMIRFGSVFPNDPFAH
jgi:WD40 repeat protein/tetratricopeptide (TPR) repeat protein/predicted Ser/Thr protein kinase